MTKTIWYKDWKGNWVKSDLPATAKNLAKVKKEVALNGQADIFLSEIMGVEFTGEQINTVLGFLSEEDIHPAIAYMVVNMGIAPNLAKEIAYELI